MIRLLSPRRLLIHSKVNAERLLSSTSKTPGDSGPKSSQQDVQFPVSFFNELEGDTQSAFDNINHHSLGVPASEWIDEYVEGEANVDTHHGENRLSRSEDFQTDNIKRTLHKNRILSDLKSFLHVCINQGMLDKAHSTFVWYRYRFLRSDVYDLSVYNLMLRAWGNAGKPNKVKELFRLMALNNIEPDLQSYACSLLALSRHKAVHREAVKNIVQELTSKGFKLEDMFIKSKLTSEQRHSIIKLLTQHEMCVEFKKDSIRSQYNSKLLQKQELEPKNYRSFSFKIHDLKKWLQEQKSLEERGIVRVKSVFKEEATPSEERDKLKSIWDKKEVEWRSSLRKALQTNLTLQKAKYGGLQGMNIYPYLTAVEINDLVEVMMDETSFLMEISQYYSPPSNMLHYKLGKRVANKYLVKMSKKSHFSEDVNLLYTKFLKAMSSNRSVNSRIFMEQLAADFGISLFNHFDEMIWSNAICHSVGKFLYEIMMSELKFDVNSLNDRKTVRNMPILFSYYKTGNNKMMEEIKAHPVFLEFARKVFSRELAFGAEFLPMVVPPLPWLSQHLGGYILTRSDFIREFATSGATTLDPNYTEHCLPVLDALNAIQLIPWKINGEVLDVAIEVLNKKGDESLDIPLHETLMPSVPKIDNNSTTKLTQKEKYQLLKKIATANRDRSEMYSQWCTCLYKLSIANHFRDRIFWMPYNLDFRSRCYTIPPHLTHIGDDLCRGVMLLGEGKPLGPKGLDWLKIHIINLTGLKKLSSVQERLDFANENIDLILDSADNPLTGKGWWKKSDEPWQTLSCCKEIAAAVRSPDPESFISHFPVHQDGSCNGLQHYAALGRDAKGGEAVNLVPHSTPQDVYTEVAKIVELRRQEDALNGNEIAKLLDGFVRRKVIKQTVMTFVYGVTRYGARAQIMKQLKDIDDFPSDKEWAASGYLTQKVFDSIQDLFTATREIQFWLTEAAVILSKSLSQPVKWTTPLGFPVVQPYLKAMSTNTFAPNGANSSERMKGLQPNSLKQKNGFPPNFIHSLDSSHMMLTALRCEGKGVDFVSIHDCYWTHPSTVDDMNQICREEFVRLHSLPILTDLSDSFLTTYSSQLRSAAESSPENYRKIINVLTRVPSRGSLNLKQVLDSVFFFS